MWNDEIKILRIPNLFRLVPEGITSIGDVWNRNAADRVVGHCAHEQQLVTAPVAKRYKWQL